MELERQPEMTARHLRPEEAEAIRILWRARGEMGDPPPGEALGLLYEVRKRQAEIEDQALSLFAKATEERRKGLGRHLLISLIVTAAIALVAARIIGLL